MAYSVAEEARESEPQVSCPTPQSSTGAVKASHVAAHRDLLAAVGRKYDQYLDFAQQDAHEFLRILLDAMRMEEQDVSFPTHTLNSASVNVTEIDNQATPTSTSQTTQETPATISNSFIPRNVTT
jgi:ubiquitin C-terminal hydrolase